MNEELKITKEDLVNWIDRPPSNDDLDLCEYLSNAVQNRQKYFEEKQKLQNNWNELKKWLEENKYFYNITGEDLEEDTTITEVLSKMQELQGDDKN